MTLRAFPSHTICQPAQICGLLRAWNWWDSYKWYRFSYYGLLGIRENGELQCAVKKQREKYHKASWGKWCLATPLQNRSLSTLTLSGASAIAWEANIIFGSCCNPAPRELAIWSYVRKTYFSFSLCFLLFLSLSSYLFWYTMVFCVISVAIMKMLHTSFSNFMECWCCILVCARWLTVSEPKNHSQYL